MTERVAEGPVTEAGRRMHKWLNWHPIDGRDDYIIAIETEAAQAARAEVIAEIRAGVEGLSRWGVGEPFVMVSSVLALLPPTEPKTKPDPFEAVRQAERVRPPHPGLVLNDPSDTGL